MENDEQNQLEIETQPKEKRPFYKCVKSSTARGFVKELNIARKAGYKPLWDTREDFTDTDYQPPITHRNVIVYDSEALELDNTEIEKRKQISDDILEAEFFATKAAANLQTEIDDLTLHTDWTVVSAEVGNKITNQSQRDAYIRSQTAEAREYNDECKQWLSHVKRLAVLHERADGKKPWDKFGVVEDPKTSLDVAVQG